MYLGVAKADIGTGSIQLEKTPNVQSQDILISDSLPSFSGNGEGSPSNVEFAVDSSQNFMIAHPEKKYYQIANFIAGGGTSFFPQAHLIWNATDAMPGWAKSFLATSSKTQSFQQPSDGAYPTDYIGPRWRNVYTQKNAPNPDDSEIASGATPATTEMSTNNSVWERYSGGIHQYQTTPGLWWGAEVSTGVDVSGPLWIDIARTGERSVPGQPSFVLIQINNQRAGTGADFGLSIWLMTNAKPKIIDWQSKQIEDMQSAPSLSPGSGIRLGLLPCCGRLILNFNGADYVYAKKSTSSSGGTGTDSSPSPDTFDFQPFSFQASDISVFGTNCQAVLSVNAMTFTKGVLHTPFPGYDDGNEGSSTGGAWPSSDLFKIAGNPTTWGACATNVPGNGDPAQKEIFANPQGKIDIEFVPSKNRDGKYAKVTLSPTNMNMAGSTIPNMGCPFFSRMQFIDPKNIRSGVSRRGNRVGKTQRLGGNDVLAVNMTFQAPDSYHAIQTAEVTLYNEGGRNNSWLERSHPITIGLGWGSAPLLFTGVTLGGYRSETAGMETIVVNCQDYMFVLDSARMINSPYYDGLDAYDAVFDLAARAGVAPIDDTGSSGYALPVGYSFTKPAMRFSKGRPIKDCILEIAKMAECCFWFDETGTMHYGGIQGGIAFNGGSSSGASFYKAPSGENTIIDEYRVENKVSEAVNEIYVETVDRTSGGLYFSRKVAGGSLFDYHKPAFISQPALGSQQACNEWITMLSQRLFKAPRGTTIKTFSSQKIVPLSIISVEGQNFRVTSIQRSYRSDDNSLTCTISGEWYG